jgi:hypothetical protein
MKKEIKNILLILVTAFVIGLCVFGIVWGSMVVGQRLYNETEQEAPKPYQETFNEGDLTITCSYSADDRLLIKNCYNTKTKVTVTYNYLYENNGWGVQLVDVKVITVNENGNIICQTEKE